VVSGDTNAVLERLLPQPGVKVKDLPRIFPGEHKVAGVNQNIPIREG
jgi:hypothetical protein